MKRELHIRYRPPRVKNLIGQPEAVKILEAKLAKNELPHTMMFWGPSGVGKTSAARSLIAHLGCGPLDVEEINCALVDDPINKARSLARRVSLAPSGKCRMWILDELQAWSKSKFAQQALLKTIEDVPDHAYFVLCTTDPDKIIDAIKTRCCQVAFKAVSRKDMEIHLTWVANKEKINLTEEVRDCIITVSDGSVRRALVLLEQIAELKTDAEQIDLVQSQDTEKAAKDICLALLSERTRWPELVPILKGITNEDAEATRLRILGFMSGCLLGKRPSPRAFRCLLAFESNFYDTRRSGLIRACWEVVHDA